VIAVRLADSLHVVRRCGVAARGGVVHRYTVNNKNFVYQS
jgi:hypothetical protein